MQKSHKQSNNRMEFEPAEQQIAAQKSSQPQQRNQMPIQNKGHQCKQTRLGKKKVLKAEQQIQFSIQLMSQRRIEDAISSIKKIIMQGQNFRVYGFEGQGFKEDWAEYLAEGPIEWFDKNKQPGKLSKNAFDLLNLCFMAQLYKQQIMCKEQYFLFYDQLALKLGQCVQVAVGRGHLYYVMGKIYEAQKKYSEALIHTTNKVQKIYECLAWVKGFWFASLDEGIRWSQKCLELNSINLGALFVRAYCQPDLQKKSQCYKKIIQRDQSYCKVYIQQGLMQQEFAEKQILFQKALFYNPRSFLARHCIILANFKVDKNRGLAINNLEELAFMHGKYEAADAFFALGQFQENYSLGSAINYYNKCLECNPYHFQAKECLARVYRMSTGFANTPTAIKLYHQYIQLNPYNCQVYNYLGLALDAQDQRLQAKTCYEKALELNPTFFEAWLNLGQSYHEQENYSEALNTYLRAEAIEHNANVCYGIAICHYKLDNYPKALQWAQQCCKNGGDDCLQVYQFLGDVNCSLHLYSQSLKYYIQYSISIKQLHTQYIMQNLINQLTKPEALDILNTAFQNAENNEKSLILYLQLGKLHEELKDYEGAVKNYLALKSLQTTLGNVRPPSKIRSYLQRIFSSNRPFGQITIIDKLTIQVMKAKFQKIFIKAYNFEDMNALLKQ